MSEPVWIPCAERLPTEEDAFNGYVWYRDIAGRVFCFSITAFEAVHHAGHWCSVTRPPEFVPPKPLELWVNLYPDGVRIGYQTREEADRAALQNRIRCVRVVEQLP
jgi:hypothetical protein